MTSVAAIDLGATSGRVVVGALQAGRLNLQQIARFLNTPVRVSDGLHWDVLALWSAAMHGVAEASRARGDLVGAAVDSWAVDYGLLAGDRLLGNPFHYRDDRTGGGVEAVHALIGAEPLYARNGLQHLPFNTLFQLAAAACTSTVEAADRMLLIPDLLGYWATGRQVAEQTNASTTGLLPVGAQDWDAQLLALLGLRRALFPEIVPPGTMLGEALPWVREEFGIREGVRFSTVGSHDTASAVVGVPLQHEDSAYISCGTWSLVGTELRSPVTTEAARVAGFTNERGVDDRIRFLKNVMGLWVLSETIRAWRRVGEVQELGVLLQQAAAAPDDVPTFDVDDPRLLAPGNMPGRIEQLFIDRGQQPPSSIPEFVRSVLQSLANAYAKTIRQLETLTGRRVRSVHLVGGGAQNALLCQLTADTVGVPVLAGPVEATAIGNVLVQLRTHGVLMGDLQALRNVTARSFPTTTYSPRTDAQKG